MNLHLSLGGTESYNSPSQRARIVTERWALENLYCTVCDVDRLTQAPNNFPAADFMCDNCSATYQLKSTQKRISDRVNDSAYSAMIQAIRTDTFPNLLLLSYDLKPALVKQLILIPSFMFSESAIIRRNPLGPSARRAGWVGCIIDLSMVPPEGKISMVHDNAELSSKQVRARFREVLPISSIPTAMRGWTLDVLTAINGIGRETFDLNDVYGYEEQLSILHPANRNIRPKIRQQLQVLRDLGVIEFLGRGQYSLEKSLK